MEFTPPASATGEVNREVAHTRDEEEEVALKCGAVIGVMTEDDVLTTLHWASLEGWNPGNGDAGPFWVADREGFFMTKLATGEPVVCISAVRYGQNYGFIGLYICASEHRGRGYGTAIFGHAMRHLEGRVIGLDAVIAQRDNYAKHGFVVEHKNIRFGGVIADVATAPPPPVQHDDSGGAVVEELRQDRMDDVVEFDEGHVPAPRVDLVRAWLTAPGHIVRVAIAGGKVKGYGVLRPSRDGAKIAPLLAESSDMAELLIRSLAGTTSKPTDIFIDVPEPNPESVALVKRLGLREMIQLSRMYRGPAPNLPFGQIFGLLSLELG